MYTKNTLLGLLAAILESFILLIMLVLLVLTIESYGWLMAILLGAGATLVVFDVLMGINCIDAKYGILPDNSEDLILVVGGTSWIVVLWMGYMLTFELSVFPWLMLVVSIAACVVLAPKALSAVLSD